VIRQLIIQLRAALPIFNANVIYNTDIDFSSTGIGIDLAKLPAMYMLGPNMPRNDLFTSHQKPSERYGAPLPDSTVPSKFRTFTAEEAIDLVFQLVILCNHQDTFLTITDKVHAYFMNGKSVSAEKCPGEPARGTNAYEIDLVGRLSSTLMANRSNLKQAVGQLIVRGVLVSDGQIFQESGVAAEVPILTTKLI